MVDTIGSTKEFSEAAVINVANIETIVNFLFDLQDNKKTKDGDIAKVLEYYKKALENAIWSRVQNQMRLRANDTQLFAIEEQIGRLEVKWSIPFVDARQTFNKAVRFIDDVREGTKEDIRDKAKEQIKKKWMDEPEIVQFFAIGQKPYKPAQRRLHHLRRMRSKYKYLELYLINIQREAINLALNLNLIVAIVEFVQKCRKTGAGGTAVSETVGGILKEIIKTSSIEAATEAIKKLNPQTLLKQFIDKVTVIAKPNSGSAESNPSTPAGPPA